MTIFLYVDKWTRACHWVSIGKGRTSQYSWCVTSENKNTCVGLDWLKGHWAFDCSMIYDKGSKTVPIYTQVWCRWELIHLRIRLQYSGIIDIIVFVYNCIKVFNRLASERYFLTLEIQLIWISTSQMELSLGSSPWRSSRRIAPRTNQASLFKNQYPTLYNNYNAQIFTKMYVSRPANLHIFYVEICLCA
jgi:hypothetical protein